MKYFKILDNGVVVAYANSGQSFITMPTDAVIEIDKAEYDAGMERLPPQQRIQELEQDLAAALDMEEHYRSRCQKYRAALDSILLLTLITIEPWSTEDLERKMMSQILKNLKQINVLVKETKDAVS